jgi:DNA-binding transcriptional MerR regulator
VPVVGENGMRIGELARRVGLSTSAVRYYEKEGLIAPVPRTDTGYRLYGTEVVGRLQFLLRAKALGLSLREVGELLASPTTDAGDQPDRVRHLIAHKIADTSRRIAELQALNQELEALYVRLIRTPCVLQTPRPECGHVGDCACWLPTEEEVKVMAEEVACCGELCCSDCSCVQGQPCDCPDCPCCSGP